MLFFKVCSDFNLPQQTGHCSPSSISFGIQKKSNLFSFFTFALTLVVYFCWQGQEIITSKASFFKTDFSVESELC